MAIAFTAVALSVGISFEHGRVKEVHLMLRDYPQGVGAMPGRRPVLLGDLLHPAAPAARDARVGGGYFPPSEPRMNSATSCFRRRQLAFVDVHHVARFVLARDHARALGRLQHQVRERVARWRK